MNDRPAPITKYSNNDSTTYTGMQKKSNKLCYYIGVSRSL